jgi:hypothetical protein
MSVAVLCWRSRGNGGTSLSLYTRGYRGQSFVTFLVIFVIDMLVIFLMPPTSSFSLAFSWTYTDDHSM